MFAPSLSDEFDPDDSYLTAQRYVFQYCDLCHQLGFQTNPKSDEEIRVIDYQVARTASEQGFTDDEIELTIWYGSTLARRMTDGDRDLYSQSFTLKTVEDDEPPEPNIDDSLPAWADYYPNFNDYLLHEFPEILSEC